jgi:hypothetical protein
MDKEGEVVVDGEASVSGSMILTNTGAYATHDPAQTEEADGDTQQVQ